MGECLSGMVSVASYRQVAHGPGGTCCKEGVYEHGELGYVGSKGP